MNDGCLGMVSGAVLTVALLLIPQAACNEHKVAVLVHGYHLQAFDWERVVWGDPAKGLLGRVPQGILVADQFDANLIIFGTGASSTAGGELEAEHTVRYLERRFDDMTSFGGRLAAADMSRLRERFLPRCVCDSVSQNTRQEVARAIDMAIDNGCSTLVLVSSSTHIPRCVRDACALLEERPDKLLAHAPLTIFACPSGTPFRASEGASRVAIVEPPHRGDMNAGMDGAELNTLVSLCVRLDAEKRAKLCMHLEAILKML